MKKVLSLVLSLVLVLGMMPVFAVEDMGSAGENLKHYEFITGGTGGDLMEDKEFTREQLAKILAELNGKAEEAAAFEGTVNFKDADKIGAWALPYVAYAVEQDWLVGNDKNEFMPKGIVSGKELLTAMLRVLGYETEWATVVEEAAEVGFTASEGELTRGQAFETIWTVVSEIPAKGSDVALGVELGKLEPETPVVTDLDFTATATNLKEVMVEFNQEVDKETVKDANFVIKKGTSTVKATASLKDGNMAVLTIKDGHLENQGAYTLTVEKVKPVNGTEIAKTTKDFTAFDRELPEAKEVKVTGPRNLDITFSEPIETAVGAKVEIKEGNTIIGNGVAVSGNIVTVNAYSNFVEGKTYSVKITGFKDYAEYANVVATLEFTYNKDVTPPVASIEKAEQDYVVVTFDKPVKGLDNEHFYHTFTAWTALEIYKDAEMKTPVATTDSVSKVYVKFYDASGDKDKNRPLPEGTVNVGISGADIKDNWGNKLGDVKLPVEIKADDVQLAYEVEVKGEDKLLLKFNKTIKEFTSANVEVLDADGKTISGLIATPALDGKEVTITLNKKLAGKTVTLNVKNVQETGIAGTKITLDTRMVEITDKTAPKVDSAYYTIKDKDADGNWATKDLFVQFSEAVDGTAALVPGNYSLVYGDDVVVLTGDVAFDGGNTRVKITLTNAQATKLSSSTDAKLQTINVKDLAGNTITPLQKLISGDVSAFKVAVEKVEATKRDTVVVTFNDILRDLKPANFKVNGTDTFTFDQSTSGSKTVVTLKHSTANLFDTNAGNVAVTVDVTGFNNSYGSAVTTLYKANGTDAYVLAGTLATLEGIQDKIAPELAVLDTEGKIKNIKTADIVDVNGSIDQVIITFTEDMDSAYVSADKFTVDGFTVTNVSTNNNVVTLTVDEQTSNGNPVVNTGLEPNVLVKAGLKDKKGNEFVAMTAFVKANDQVAPRIKTAVATVMGTQDQFGAVNDKLVVTFSEDVTMTLADTAADTEGYFDMTAAEFASVTGLTAADGAMKAKVSGTTVEIVVVTEVTAKLAVDGTVDANGTTNAIIKDTQTSPVSPVDMVAATGVKLNK